ncbi:MAG: FAD-dependent oxidoreductase [Gammaproteobacteria bacterium]|nr:FAD-dependent oxidoreductase [Gammaproteobacteria bacterium]
MPGKPFPTIAVVGSGAAGLAAAWLLGDKYQVTLFEKDDRLGGHAHTAAVSTGVGASDLPIDTGFIVYNELNYPNLTRWLEALGVETLASNMSFAVSQDSGEYEYKGGDLAGLVAQPSNLVKPRFWRMLKDLTGFYRQTMNSPLPDADVSLRDYLHQGGYSDAFINDHLLPFGAAIWSTSQNNMLDYPAASFIRFCANHGLLQLSDRPQWRTIKGGSRVYVDEARRQMSETTVFTSTQIVKVRRHRGIVRLEDRDGNPHEFDHVILATHADQALALLDDPDEHESSLLSPFEYDQNLAILHTDTRLMPKRRRAWASWNYINQRDGNLRSKASVSYWMNSLQSLDTEKDYFVSLNPDLSPDPDTILRSSVYEHPIFNANTLLAQQQLWSLQGRRNTWFCGAYFGAGFHEDAIQAGLAVAEELGGVKRPWLVENESGRIIRTDRRFPVNQALVA